MMERQTALALIALMATFIFIGTLSFNAANGSQILPDAEYARLAAENKVPTGAVSESMHAISYWSSLGFITTGITSIAIICALGIMRYLRKIA
jgi:hypothetical protein